MKTNINISFVVALFALVLSGCAFNGNFAKQDKTKAIHGDAVTKKTTEEVVDGHTNTSAITLTQSEAAAKKDIIIRQMDDAMHAMIGSKQLESLSFAGGYYDDY